MKELRRKVAGLDVHRDTVVAAIRLHVSDSDIEVKKATFKTTAKGLSELSQFLLEYEVTTVAMEATGVYWKPVYYALEGLVKELWLCNAQHVKNVPGRKTDLNDAEWLADVVAHGMIKPSFVPPEEIRELRELTRYRKTQVDARVKEIQRLEKVLQDACIKITSVASGVWSMSSREIIEAMIDGQRDPKVLAQLAKSRLRGRIPELEEALSGFFKDRHAFMCKEIITHIDQLDESIVRLTKEITKAIVPFKNAVALVVSIPGVSRTTAEIIIAETGGDMKQFPTPGQFSAWAGLAPASYESAGKRKPVGLRKGAPYLKRAMVESARAAARTKGTYYNAQYSRITKRRGPNKAAVAVAHSMIVAIWHLFSTGALYEDPGPNYFNDLFDSAKQVKRLTARIKELGYEVQIKELSA